MAKLVGVYNTAHSPFCYMPPERWNEVRSRRSLREDVPFEDLATNLAKGERIQNGFATLAKKIEAVDPDVVVIFGNDQLESFDFTNFPAFSVYVGETFDGQLADVDRNYGQGTGRDRPMIPKSTLTGHPQLATSILTGVMQRGFDPAFSMETPPTDRGIGHAIMRPAESLGLLDKPIVPVLLNCYYAPQPTAVRCYELGRTVREVIEADPSSLRVAVIGSGGLWHTPGAKEAYLDEDFDQGTLRHMATGDIRGMAEHFDNYKIPDGDHSQQIGERGREVTGMPGFGGPQGGTRETCNWVAAAGAADGSRATIVDYVPVYASPIGAAFAYWAKP